MFRRSLVYIALILLTGIPLLPAHAQAANPGVDVIVVFENSQRVADDILPRREALEFIGDTLARDALFNRTAAENTLTVIPFNQNTANDNGTCDVTPTQVSFGPYTDVEGTLLDANPADRLNTDTATLRRDLNQIQGENGFEVIVQDYTCMVKAIDEDFGAAAPGGREQVIILITAGEPQEVAARATNNVLNAFSSVAGGRDVFVVLLPNAGSATNESFGNASNWSNSTFQPTTVYELGGTAGDYDPQNSSTDPARYSLAEAMFDTLSDTLGFSQVIQPEINVPYFTDSLDVVAFGDNPTSTNPGSTPFADFNKTPATAITLDNPAPSAYRIAPLPGPGNRVFARRVTGRGEFQLSNTLPQWTQQTMTYQVVDAAGQPFDYPNLTGEALVTIQDESNPSVTPYNVRLTSSSETGVLSGAFIPPTPGEYRVTDIDIIEIESTDEANLGTLLPGFTATPLTLSTASSEGTTALVSKRLVFTIGGLATTNSTLALEPRLTVQADPPNLPDAVTLSQGGAPTEYEADFIFERANATQILQINAAVDIPTTGEPRTVTIPQFAAPTLAVNAPEATVALGSDLIYDDSGLALTITTPGFNVNTLSNFDLALCAQFVSGNTPVTATGFDVERVPYTLTTPFVPQTTGNYTLTVDLVPTGTCVLDPRPVPQISLATREYTVRPVFLGFVDTGGNQAEVPQLEQFAPQDIRLALFEQDAETYTPTRTEVSNPPPLPLTLDATAITATHTGNSIYGLSIDGRISRDALTLFSTSIAFLDTNTTEVTLPMNPADIRLEVTRDDGPLQQFGQANITLTIDTSQAGEDNVVAALQRSLPTVQIFMDASGQPPVGGGTLTRQGSTWTGTVSLPFEAETTLTAIVSASDNITIIQQDIARDVGPPAVPLTVEVPTEQPQYSSLDLSVIQGGDIAAIPPEWAGVFDQRYRLCFQVSADGAPIDNTVRPTEYDAQTGAYRPVNLYPLDNVIEYRVETTVRLERCGDNTPVLRTIAASGRTAEADTEAADETTTDDPRPFVRVGELRAAFVNPATNAPYVPTLDQFIAQTVAFGLFYQTTGDNYILIDHDLFTTPELTVASYASRTSSVSNQFNITLPAPPTAEVQQMQPVITLARDVEMITVPLWSEGTQVMGNIININVNEAEVSVRLNPPTTRQFENVTIEVPISSGDRQLGAFDTDTLTASAQVTFPGENTPSQDIVPLTLDTDNGQFVSETYTVMEPGIYEVQIVVMAGGERLFTRNTSLNATPLALQPIETNGEPLDSVEVDLRRDYVLEWRDVNGETIAPANIANLPTVSYTVVRGADEIDTPLTQLAADTNYAITDWRRDAEGAYRFDFAYDFPSVENRLGEVPAPFELFTVNVGDVEKIIVALQGSPQQVRYTRLVPAFIDRTYVQNPSVHQSTRLTYQLVLVADENDNGVIDASDRRVSYAGVFGDSPPEDTLTINVDAENDEAAASIGTSYNTDEGNAITVTLTDVEQGENYTFAVAAPATVPDGYRIVDTPTVGGLLTTSPLTVFLPSLMYGGIIVISALIIGVWSLVQLAQYKRTPHLGGYLRLEDSAGDWMHWEEELTSKARNTVILKGDNIVQLPSNIRQVDVTVAEGDSDAVVLYVWDYDPTSLGRLMAAIRSIIATREFKPGGFLGAFNAKPTPITLKLGEQGHAIRGQGDGAQYLAYRSNPADRPN